MKTAHEPETHRTHVRWLIRRDMTDVLRIERESYQCPWTEDDFLKHLRQRNCVGHVAEYENRVVGFVIYELHKGFVHITNMAVDPDCRGRGFGRALMDKMKAKITLHHRTRLRCIVRESNLGSQLFLRRMKMRATKTLRNYCDDPQEDAYLFVWRLT